MEKINGVLVLTAVKQLLVGVMMMLTLLTAYHLVLYVVGFENSDYFCYNTIATGVSVALYLITSFILYLKR